MNNCYDDVPLDKWNDWHWQMANRITRVTQLEKKLPLDTQTKNDIQKCLLNFRMSITPYYLSLINSNNVNDPIRKQCIPTIEETYCDVNDLEDPLNEVKDSPVENIVHRYPDRVLFLVTMHCSMYCRHCTRRRVVGETDTIISEKQLQTGLNYIRNHQEIRDVLISGGDPLVMSTNKLEHIISQIRAIKHVEIIRIGTRVPVVLPMRINDNLLRMLKKYQPIWINTHFNHPNEITLDASIACKKIVDAGIPLGNQTVLLKGINNDVNIMKTLLLNLVKNRVRPYYLYQCDLSVGIGHFRTNVDEGIDIMHQLRGFISGYALPVFVIDAPKGGGKIPVSYNYVISKNTKEVVLENYLGKKYTYPQPKK